MLRSWRTSAGGGALPLLLILAWIVSASSIGASSVKDAPHGKSTSTAKVGHTHPTGAVAKPVASHQWTGSSKSAGSQAHTQHGGPAGSLTRLENQLDREIAEVRQLEQSIDNLLDDANGQNYPGSNSGSSFNGRPQGNQSNGTGSVRHHPRRGHMWQGMELARLTYRLERDERRLASEERKLDRELVRLRELEQNLRRLNNASKVGHQTANANRKSNSENRHTSAGQGPKVTNGPVHPVGNTTAHAGAQGAPIVIINHTPQHAAHGPAPALGHSHANSGPSHGSMAKGASASHSRPPVSHPSASAASHARTGARAVGTKIAAHPPAHHH